jgi:hypothetical protein
MKRNAAHQGRYGAVFLLGGPERFPLEKFKAEMAQAGYTLAAQHDFLPRQQFLIFEVAGGSGR